MAGKSKSCYLSIVELKTHKTVFRKTFFNAKDMNTFIKSDPKMAEYPLDVYYIVKETY